jgi:hypothetical protein
MLSMDYFDRNGNKWSIEKGDWLGHQAEDKKKIKVKTLKTINNKLKLLIIVIVVIITGIVTFV